MTLDTIPTNTLQKRIVIQGVPGAFHEIASRYFYKGENIKIVPSDTFDDLIETTSNVELADGALMAIENTISGSLLYNYQLLNQSDLHTVGEVSLRIRQNLMVLPGQKIEDITEVYSHPVAIAQCRKFFKQYPHIKLIEAEDTALSAKRVWDNQMKHAGAIASSLAASMYKLDIIGPSIETYKSNYTRFLVLSTDESKVKDFNKVSICFSLPHQSGSLSNVMTGLSLNNANLTKIQSVPLPDSGFEYLFFVDFLLEETKDYDSILNVLKKHTSQLRILGKYKEGEQYES